MEFSSTSRRVCSKMPVFYCYYIYFIYYFYRACRGISLLMEVPQNWKGKKVYFYIAQYPVHWTARSALYFSSPGRPVHSDANSASSGSILAAISRKDYSHISTTPYSQLLINKIFNTHIQSLDKVRALPKRLEIRVGHTNSF